MPECDIRFYRDAKHNAQKGAEISGPIHDALQEALAFFREKTA